MEVGAVKQAFNNELIALKKNLNQARTQIIHKLTRKAKTLIEKKAPEALKEKLKKKAESAVNEVLILKKIKVKDLAQFMITHQGELKDYLNRPNVDQNKAYARLLLHKALQEKYKHVRGKFTKVPIRDLFMSRQERLKLKKEAKEKQKNKKKGKNAKVVNAEGDWDVEDIKIDGKKPLDVIIESDIEADIMSSTESDHEMQENSDNDQRTRKVLGVNVVSEQSEEDNESEADDNNDDNYGSEGSDGDDGYSCSDKDGDLNEQSSYGSFVKLKPDLSIQVKKKTKPDNGNVNNLRTPNKILPSIKKSEKKKDVNKNKNLNEKLLQRKFKKGDYEAPITQNKVVDPFFITATGENYMSVAEPRQPDEVKEIHKQGNRKLRRAAMFGHVPKIKPKANFDNSIFRENEHKNSFRGKFKNTDSKNNDKGNFNDKKYDRNRNFNSTSDEKLEKLHPSWEAKKKQSGILPFQGKKIVFDEI